jgi:hypothetical protein
MSRAAAILGGGPSLPEDLKRLPPDCWLISVNDHAFHHCKPHVLVYQDELKRSYTSAVRAVAENFDGMIVCPFEESHVTLPRGWWDENMSSALATWFALWSDCDPVLLCGMDCYQGDVKYCHPRPEFDHPIFRVPLEHHLERWRQAFTKCPHPERIKAVSGPLVDIFGQYVMEGVEV